MLTARLPAETRDNVVDFLRHSKHAFEACCLVSKSWIPRTRMYLFAHVAFPTVEHMRSWKRTFPDPSTSPACYVKTLSTVCFKPEDADADSGDWIRTFSRVVH